MSRKSLCLEMVFEDRPFHERFGLAAAHGIDAVEFWEWRPKDLEAVVAGLDEHDLELVGMAGLGTSGPDLTDPDLTEVAIDHVEESIATATRIGCPNLIVLVGDHRPEEPRQTQSDRIVDTLRELAPAAERADVTLLVEPLNTAVDHPGYFLETAAEGFDIIDAVDSSHVQLLYDVYHQQITEGNIIANLTDREADVGHIHIADVPGRHEPGTGELAYSNILAAVADAGYEGYYGFEFQPATTVEAAIESMRQI